MLFRSPIDTRFEHISKCARAQLGASALKWVLSEFPISNGWDIEVLKKNIQKINNSWPNLQKYNRTSLSDQEVLNFIEKQHKELVSLSASPLLKMLRDSNFACEQSRFANLFRAWVSAQKV